jgi:hydrogenase-4 component B
VSDQTWVLVAGAALTLVGSLLVLLPGAMRAGLLAQAIGTTSLGAAGLWIVLADTSIGHGFSNGLLPRAGVDPLSAWMLVLLAVVAVPPLVYADGYLAESVEHPRAIASVGGLFVLALAGVLVARDAISFLFAWEAMSLTPVVAILLDSRTREVCSAVLVYLGLTHLAGVGVWITMLTLTHLHAFGAPDVIAGLSPTTRSLLAAAALIGFGAKAGLAPLHTWLPRAHPVAPSHISAIMSGAMVKVALYGLVRAAFEWLAPVPAWVAPVLLVVAVLSCLSGITYAILQRDLKRLLAFSTVENVGIITLGLAASLLAADAGHAQLAAVAFAAAMLHALNHGVFKSLLFLGAGSVHRRVHTLDLDRLGGLLRTMPVTGAAMLVGCVSIAGIPPFNGFASEWLTFQSLIQLTLVNGSATTLLLGALAAAALAATAALSVYCFVRVAGLMLLGAHRQHAAAQAREVPRSMRGPVLVLAALCVVLGIVPGLVLARLESLSPFGSLPAHSTSSMISLPASGTLRPLALVAAIVLLAAALQRARRRAGATTPSRMWLCGQEPTPRLAWTSAGFHKPLSLVLVAALRPRRDLDIEREHGIVRRVEHDAKYPHLFDELLLSPVVRAGQAASRVLRRTQSGSLRAYLTILLATLAVTLGAVRIGVGS